MIRQEREDADDATLTDRGHAARRRREQSRWFVEIDCPIAITLARDQVALVVSAQTHGFDLCRSAESAASELPPRYVTDAPVAAVTASPDDEDVEREHRNRPG
jgi:hypothetical protein